MNHRGDVCVNVTAASPESRGAHQDLETNKKEPQLFAAAMTTQVDDAHISVRFKHGIHTIFLFVDSLAPFSSVTEELLEVLRERYPDGLTKSTASPEKTPIPEMANITYGVLRVPNDPLKGWKALKLGDGAVNTPTKCGLKNNSFVAFTVVEDDNEDDVEFEVEWPKEDEELYEEEA